MTASKPNPTLVTADFRSTPPPFDIVFAGTRFGTPPEQSVKTRLEDLTDSTFVSFALEGGAVSIWVADNRGMRFYLANGPAGEVIAAARRLQLLCQDPTSSDTLLKKHCRRLHHLLLEPVASLLEAQREVKLHLAANFPFVPMSLLEGADGNRFGDVYTHRYVTDFPWDQQAEGLESIDAGAKLLLVDADSGCGCPDYLMQVAMLFPQSDMLCGPAATWEKLARLAPAAELLHIRSRASLGERGPLLQVSAAARGEQMSEGPVHFLDPAEVAPDWLRTCKLAVLDLDWVEHEADNENPHVATDPMAHAPLDLAHAMHRMGAARTIFAAWPVEASARATYFNALYNGLADGHSPQSAVHWAAQALRQESRWCHPHYWASFQCCTRNNLQQ